MLGFTNGSTDWGYMLSILVAILCIIYGLIYWNKGTENEKESPRG